MKKYKFVVFGDAWDVYQVAHREWIEDPLISYVSTFRPKGIIGQLQRLHFNPRLNSFVSLPYKPLWNSTYIRQIDEENLCFLITDHWLRMECGIRLMPYLRRHYPNARIVCFLLDLVDNIIDHYSHRPIDVAYIKEYVDLFITYDKTDARRYDLSYHPTVYSAIPAVQNAAAPIYDLYFLGRDKGRLKRLVAICQEAQRRQLKCHFLMVEVPKSQQVKCEGITYLDGTLTYAENLRNCARSKCLVEMLQKDASSPTFRNWESIMLNKRLLTNNRAIIEADIYDVRYITVFHDIDDIDWQALAAGSGFADGVNPYQDMIKPISLVRFIEEHLHIQIAHS